MKIDRFNGCKVFFFLGHLGKKLGCLPRMEHDLDTCECENCEKKEVRQIEGIRIYSGRGHHVLTTKSAQIELWMEVLNVFYDWKFAFQSDSKLLSIFPFLRICLKVLWAFKFEFDPFIEGESSWIKETGHIFVKIVKCTHVMLNASSWMFVPPHKWTWMKVQNFFWALTVVIHSNKFDCAHSKIIERWEKNLTETAENINLKDNECINSEYENCDSDKKTFVNFSTEVILYCNEEQRWSFNILFERFE